MSRASRQAIWRRQRERAKASDHGPCEALAVRRVLARGIRRSTAKRRCGSIWHEAIISAQRGLVTTTTESTSVTAELSISPPARSAPRRTLKSRFRPLANSRKADWCRPGLTRALVTRTSQLSAPFHGSETRATTWLSTTVNTSRAGVLRANTGASKSLPPALLALLGYWPVCQDQLRSA